MKYEVDWYWTKLVLQAAAILFFLMIVFTILSFEIIETSLTTKQLFDSLVYSIGVFMIFLSIYIIADFNYRIEQYRKSR